MPVGAQTAGYAGAAATDILGGQATRSGLRITAAGNFAEADEYDLAATLAKRNMQFTKSSTEVKMVMNERDIERTIGLQREQTGALGFAESGSSLDLLRDSAAQGSLSQALIGQQGLITEAGYKEQAESFHMMSAAARMAGEAEQDQGDTAARNGWITGGIIAAAAVATVFTGGAATPLLAASIAGAGATAATGGYNK